MCSGDGRRFISVSADTRFRICTRYARTNAPLWVTGTLHGSRCTAARSMPSASTDHGRDAP
eukprot:2596306-Pyramimonas_sp.AAC.1